MAQGSKIKFNRSKVHELDLIIADGLFAVGQQIIETGMPNAPDSPEEPYPLGEGLPRQGGVLAYVDGKKVAGWSGRGTQPRAPRAAKVSRHMGIIVIVGWGFPARFNEIGTVHQAPHPFVAPARDEVLPRGISILRPVFARLGSRP
jgi:hypothetical protein